LFLAGLYVPKCRVPSGAAAGEGGGLGRERRARIANIRTKREGGRVGGIETD
jgi:hypothetical protein